MGVLNEKRCKIGGKNVFNGVYQDEFMTFYNYSL